ncbi:hypothetical protein FBU30_007393 [Linnemannia zychae]|nr:hypothetical protein FBU30_007393 [Linnemannia zychae]
MQAFPSLQWKNSAQFKGTLDCSIPPKSSTPSSKPELSNSDTEAKVITPTSDSSSNKTFVFKKPTKHQFSWSELKKMVASKDLSPMARSEMVQETYQKAIKRRTKKYGSPDEYIRQRVLHWPPAEELDTDGDESSSSCSTLSPPSSPTGPISPLEVNLKKNEFPYSVKPGIEHWLIWSRYPLTDEAWIRSYLEERLPGREYLFFVNPPELRSVPTIFHVQVFTKGQGEVLDELDMEIKKEERNATAEAAAATLNSPVSPIAAAE